MKADAHELLAGLLRPERISRGRLMDAVSAAWPSTWTWCERPQVAASRAVWCEALISALPQVLLIGWRECLQRASHTAAVRQAEFRPEIEFFEDGAVGLTLPVGVRIAWQRLEAPDEVHARLQLAIGRAQVASAVFHEVEQDMKLPVGCG